MIRQLKPQDAQFLYMETENNLSNATMVCVYAPPTDNTFSAARAVRQQFEQRLHLSSIFRHRIKTLPFNLDYPYWEKAPHFNLDHHISDVAAPAPGDRATLNRITAQFHSRPLDLRRPPWEAVVVTGLNHLEGLPTNSFAVLIKIHHAAIDGVAAMKLFLGLHDNSPTPETSTDTPFDDTAYNLPTRKHLLHNARRNYLNAPASAVSRIAKQLGALRKASSDDGTAGDKKHPVPKTRFNQPVGPEKKLATTFFPLDQLKALRQLHPGATLNDIILAISSGGLHRYLSGHKALPNIPLVAWVPINARQPDNADADGNNISATAIALASQIRDPMERLKRIVAATRDAKEARSGLAARMVTDLTQHLPSTGMAAFTQLLLASNTTGKLCNLAVSNVPGPQQALYLAGAECREQFGMVPLADRMGLFFVVMSYNGRLSLSITSTEDILPDHDTLIDALHSEFQWLCQQLGQPA